MWHNTLATNTHLEGSVRFLFFNFSKEQVRLLKDGLWVTFGNVSAAVATVVGVRVITEYVAPSLFGVYTLINGIIAFFQGILFLPLAQAAFRYYPEFEKLSAVSALRQYLYKIFLQRWLRCSVVFGLGGVIATLTFRYLNIPTWLIIYFALGIEGWKVVEIVMRNAARRQCAYATLFALDAIARPVGVVSLLCVFGPSIESLLLGQTLATFFLLLGFVIFSDETKKTLYETSNPRKVDINLLGESMRKFAKPLLWSPIIGWANGLADRYIVGGMLGLSQAGIYSAAYGLGSRPMLLIGGISEATFRQLLYQSTTQKNQSPSKKIMLLWVIFNIAAGMAVVILVSCFAKLIVRWLLAQEYRPDAAAILPWITLGYISLLLAQPFERLAYSKDQTQAIVLIQGASAIIAIVLAVFGAWWRGLMGVAMAVPVYYTVQLLLTIFVAKGSSKVIYENKTIQ